MRGYKVLCKQRYKQGDYSIVPIRDQDRYDIMKWRNEQIYHLRQAKPLTKEDQDLYFDGVVKQLFSQEKPSQLLFSYLKGDTCIGYGGLVHINWTDRNAEISFVMDTSLEANSFIFHWVNYLSLLEEVAFKELNMHKFYTYAFDLRDSLYAALEKSMFNKEAVLQEHCLFQGKFIDVVIHSKLKTKKTYYLKSVSLQDTKLLFNWANDKEVRRNAINTTSITWDKHVSWLIRKISSANSKMFVLYNKLEPIGQLRLDYENDWWVIDYSIDEKHRGKGYGTIMLKELLDIENNLNLKALVKQENKGSLRVFEKLDFNETGVVHIGGEKFIEFQLMML